MVLSRKSKKKCFYYWSVFIDNEGLGGSQWHTHCGHIYYGKILSPQNFFTPFCYNYNVVKCDLIKKNSEFMYNSVSDS